MSSAMRRVRDRDLREPFRAWIDRGVPLPPGVTVLPRNIDVFGDALALIILGGPCLVAGGVFVGAVSGWLRHFPDTGGMVFLTLGLIVWLGVPIWAAHRLCRTIGARGDQKAGTLRQGVLVGPEGVLVRLAPNWCYPIPIDRYITAGKWSGGGSDGIDYLRIETRDGPVDFADEHLTVGAAEVNDAVRAVRA
jgi:hypothetical protein